MSNEEGAPQAKGKRKMWIVAVVVALVVVAAIAAVVLMQKNDGGGTNENINTPLQDMIVKGSDLPSGWRVAAAYQPGYQGTLPGPYSEAGGTGLAYNESGSQKLYVTVLLVRCANVTSASDLFDACKAALETNVGATHNGTVGDHSVIVNSTTGSKYLWFIHKNILCGIVFMPTVGFTYSDAQAEQLALIQLDKIA